MNIPCKNCLVLAMCKGRINNSDNSNSYGYGWITPGWVTLYNVCNLFKDCYNYSSKADLDLKKIFGKNYIISVNKIN